MYMFKAARCLKGDTRAEGCGCGFRTAGWPSPQGQRHHLPHPPPSAANNTPAHHNANNGKLQQDCTNRINKTPKK
ncbi:unnamed protein product [Nezara viridula]|uniref:Uncharacterized protein n=1 Tax=Nezara viridula TaxID=85310 RepID=A0A9P0ECD2_NEZVI|nr:unnamed protein product [Nezara viridula]